MAELNITYNSMVPFNGSFIIKHFIPFYDNKNKLAFSLNDFDDPFQNASYVPLLKENCGCFKLSFYVNNENVNKIALIGYKCNFVDGIINYQNEILLGWLNLFDDNTTTLDKNKLHNVYFLSKIIGENVSGEAEEIESVDNFSNKFSFDENNQVFITSEEISLDDSTKLSLFDKDSNNSLKYNNSHNLYIGCDGSPEIVPLQMATNNKYAVDFIFDVVFKLSDYKLRYNPTSNEYNLPIFNVKPLNVYGKKGEAKSLFVKTEQDENNYIRGFAYNNNKLTPDTKTKQFNTNVLINNDTMDVYKDRIAFNNKSIKDDTTSITPIYLNNENFSLENIPIGKIPELKFVINSKDLELIKNDNLKNIVGVFNNNTITNDSITIYTNSLYNHLSAPSGKKFSLKLSNSGIEIISMFLDSDNKLINTRIVINDKSLDDWVNGHDKQNDTYTQDQLDTKCNEIINYNYKDLAFSLSTEDLKNILEEGKTFGPNIMKSICETKLKKTLSKLNDNYLLYLFNPSQEDFTFNMNINQYTTNEISVKANECLKILLTNNSLLKL